MVKGIYLPADENAPLEVREFGDYTDYQAAVGGLIDAVDLYDIGATIYVNDEGLVIHLPFNSRATFLWWLHAPQARNQAYLVGDALVVGIPDDDGETTNIPDELLRALTYTGLFRVEVQLQSDPKWYTNLQRYPDFWEAAVWAGLLRERWGEVELIRVVPDEPSRPEEPADDDSFNEDDPQVGDPT